MYETFRGGDDPLALRHQPLPRRHLVIAGQFTRSLWRPQPRLDRSVSEFFGFPCLSFSLFSTHKLIRLRPTVNRLSSWQGHKSVGSFFSRNVLSHRYQITKFRCEETQCSNALRDLRFSQRFWRFQIIWNTKSGRFVNSYLLFRRDFLASTIRIQVGWEE